ncbi:MAG: vWA domain-containing protein [Blastocatellia bacterium]
MPVFTLPFAFIALALAIPALAAIYWLRNRARERRVSSLLLWLDERQRWEGGRRVHRLRTPLLFFLELLAILLLAAAAAGPLLRAGDAARPLVVVLDDSFSMRAGAAETARDRAVRAIESELRGNRYNPVRFVLAGESPQLLGEAGEDVGEALRLLRGWHCGAATAKLDEAVAFGFELGGPRARLLVVTDHAPPEPSADGRLQWRAFGAAASNFAIVQAARGIRDTEDRVMIEVANLAPSPGATTLEIDSAAAQSLALAAGETRRIVLTLKPGAPPLRARLREDALRADNELLLLPDARPPVRVEVRIKDATLRSLTERALESIAAVTRTADRPDLMITDETGGSPSTDNPQSWTLHLLREPDAASLLGPFVLDRTHPLTEGISLGGVVWGAGRSEQLPGTPVITAGNIPLLTDLDRAGAHELRLRLRPDLSTLQETPTWPILLANLIAWRADAAPGLRPANIRLGEQATLTLAPGIDAVTLIDPSRNSRRIPVVERSIALRADAVGLHEIDAAGIRFAFAANALRREESDLTQAASGRWGNWANAASLQWEYRGIAWALLLMILILLGFHAWLIRSNVAPLGVPPSGGSSFGVPPSGGRSLANG